MGAWSLYFLAKLGLYYSHASDLHWLENFALAVALAWPLEHARLRKARTWAAIPLALALAYYDLRLPPLPQLVDDVAALAGFRAGYLLELARRAALLPFAAALIALVFLYSALHERLRFATLAFVGLVAAAILPPSQPGPAVAATGTSVRPGDSPAPGSILSPAALDAALQTFYASQRGKTVSFVRAGTARFDLVLLSVCSLSYDDLDYTHMREDPLLARFDVVFRQFNTAATYSGPALLRLLHGTCGQMPQGELYNPSPEACYLFRGLAAAGYQPALLLNHDGRFDHFAEQLRVQGGMGIDPEDNSAARVFMTAFDGTPLRSDADVLTHWWSAHQRDEGHNALLYNTISLHDGNRVPGQASASSLITYVPRLRRLFADLNGFIDLVQASGRPTVVVLIPEHGAALHADAVQIAGLRELPTRAITNVPVAVKLIGLGARKPAGQPPLLVDAPSSYLALTALIAGITRLGSAASDRGALEGLVRALPTTQWIAENNGTVLLRRDSQSYLRTPQGEWTDYIDAPNP
ncbi:MAG TPA: cellulose biosynthesis protein BcsG [Burkholderiaceae bacterium]|nr:cellulose biosynthesis protein BcsG [Burkholderiaceae bacterium]